MEKGESNYIVAEEFKKLIMSSLDGFRILDSNGVILEVNDAYCELVGTDREYLIGSPITDIEIHEKYALFELHFENMQKVGSAVYETKHLYKDGSLKYFEASEVYTELQGGCLYAFLRDITSRKKNEIALKKSEERIRNLLETIPDGVYKSTPKGKLLEANPAMIRMLGYESKEALLSIDIKKDLYFEENEREAAINPEITSPYDIYRLKKKDGSELWVEDSFKFIYDMNGDIEYHEGVIRDVSERLRLEKTIKENEEKFRAILETIPYPIFAKDANLNYIACNKAFEDYIDKSKDEIIGYDVYKIADKSKADIYYQADIELLRNEKSQVYIGEVKISDGSIKLVRFHKNLLKDNSGQIIGIVGLIIDLNDNEKMPLTVNSQEQRFRELIETSYDAIILTDADSNIIYSSLNANQIIGFGAKKIFNSFLLKKLSDEDYHEFLNDFNELSETPNAAKTIVLTIKDENSNDKRFECTLSNKLNDEVLQSIVVKFQDITIKIRNEEIIANQLSFLEALIDSLPYPAFIKNASARFVGCNKAYEKVFSIERSYLLGKTVLDLEYLPQEDREKFQKEDTEVIENASRLSYELPILYADGKIHSTLYTVDGFKLKNGKPGGLIGLLVDITDRKEAQEALLRISKIQSLILNNSSVGIALVRNRVFEWVNPSLCELFGYNVNYINGFSTQFIFKDEQAFKDFYITEYPKLSNDEKSDSIIELKKNDGSLFWCRLIGNAIDSAAYNDGSIWMFEDISERIENEEKIKKYIAELKELNATKDKFFSIIAHDLKNPLGSFNAICELLVSEYDSIPEKDKKDFILSLKESASSVYNLLENLLEWSRSQRAIIKFEPQKADIFLISKYIIAVLEIQAGNKNVAINNLIPENSFATFDINMVSTIIRNLISNAIKYSNKNGHINIGLINNVGDYLQIYIEDDGIGMEEEKLGKLFKIEESHSELGTDKEKGTGLGLILCKEFVDKHNGKIWAESNKGNGSKFYFTLPK